MRVKIINLSFVMLVLFLLTSCNNKELITSDEVDRIKLEVINTTTLPEGISYSIKLTNSSKYTIKQNNVFLSYPIETVNGLKGNEFKIEAKNNKLDIKPNEELVLQAFAPIDGYYQNNKIDSNKINIEIVGYLNQVSEEQRFQKMGGEEFLK